MFNITTKIKKHFKNKFTFSHKKEESKKLTKLAIIFLIFLNIFTITIIQQGIYFQTNIIDNPNKIYPYNCRNKIKNSNKMDNINKYNKTYFKNIYSKNSKKNISNSYQEKNKNTVCSNIDLYVKSIQANFKNDIISYKKNITANNKIEYKVNKLRKQYNTSLIENLNEYSNYSKNEKKEYDSLLKQITINKNQNIKINKKFKSDIEVQKFKLYLNNNKSIINKYKEEMKWFFYKQYLFEFLFLLPLLLFFFYRMKINNKKQKYINFVIDKNLFIISSLFLFVLISRFIYFVLPHTFLNYLFEFFINLNIPFFIYYFILIIGVGIFSFLIIKFNKKKNIDNSLSFKKDKDYLVDCKCINCNSTVDYLHMDFCWKCGSTLKKECLKCKKTNYIFNLFCSSCGINFNLIKLKKED